MYDHIANIYLMKHRKTGAFVQIYGSYEIWVKGRDVTYFYVETNFILNIILYWYLLCIKED